MRRHDSRAITIPLLAALLLAGACYTLEPVQERLAIAIGADGRAKITIETIIRQPDRDESPGEESLALRRRLDRLQSDIEAGQDDWSRRITKESAGTLRWTQEWEAGALALSRREAEIGQEQIAELFDGTDVDAFVIVEDGWSELTLAPLPPSRATQQQRQAVKGALERFADAELRYVRAMGAVHEHLDAHPEDAARAYERMTTIVSTKDAGEASPAERLYSEAGASIEALGEFFFVESGFQGWSFDALTRLVHDSFPAEVTVSVPSEPLELGGFVRAESADGATGVALRVPSRSLWTALRGLQGRWVQPDLAVVMLDAALRDDEPDLEALAAEPRRFVSPIGIEEVRAALAEGLSPQEPLRVRWATAEAADAGP